MTASDTPRRSGGLLSAEQSSRAIAILEEAGYVSSESGAPGTYSCRLDDVSPWTGATDWYVRVVEDPARPVLDRLGSLLSVS